MLGFSKTIAAAFLVFSFAAPAMAQVVKEPEAVQLQERNVYLFMNGKMVHMKASDATHAMVMKEFTPMADGALVYVSGGKLYMAPNKKMADGKMLHTEMLPGFDLGSLTRQ
jgi:hypothetical protein